jgi:hypothetical protein
MSQQQQTIQLEAFNTDLHGTRILLFGTFPSGKIPPVMESIQHLRDPFKKKVLLTQSPFAIRKLIPCQYDAVFQAKDQQDWQLILTYLTYAPKPLLVVAEEVPVPDGLWQKIGRTITFVHHLTKLPTTAMKLPLTSMYDVVFFAPSEEVHTAFTEQTYKMLHSMYRPSYTYQEHKEILNELRVAGAGIAWSNVNEKTPGGAIYWYDVVEHSMEERLTNKQLSELFSWLSSTFSG